MRLHKDKEAFLEYVAATAEYYGLNPAVVEKDYYVTLFLRKAVEEIVGIVFKGGTSLSKCYKLIDRFSEDIDLTLDNEHFTQGKRSNANKTIAKICEEIGLSLKNPDQIRSRREYNCFYVEYPISYFSEALKPELKIETAFMQKSYPDDCKTIQSLIGEFFTENGYESLAKTYGLIPFEIKVQALERTFVDKVFALCDYRLGGKAE